MSFFTIDTEKIIKPCAIWLGILMVTWGGFLLLTLIDGAGYAILPIMPIIWILAYSSPVVTAVYGGLLAFSPSSSRNGRILGISSLAAVLFVVFLFLRVVISQ